MAFCLGSASSDEETTMDLTDVAKVTKSAQEDRSLSTDIMESVLAGAGQCFQDEGVPPEILERFRTLWLSKLEGRREHDPDLDLDTELEGVAAAPGPSRPATSSSSKASKAKVLKKKKAHVRSKKARLSQVDGPNDSSDDDDELDGDDLDDDDDDDDDLDDDDAENEEEAEEGVEEEPLGSEDDISDEDPSDLFDTENVVVCQYDKITRARNKWKFHLKDGIMNLNGKDYVFQKATGDAEW